MQGVTLHAREYYGHLEVQLAAELVAALAGLRTDACTLGHVASRIRKKQGRYSECSKTYEHLQNIVKLLTNHILGLRPLAAYWMS